MSRSMSVPDETIPWDMVAACRASDCRKQVLTGLYQNPRCAAELAEDMDFARPTISKHIHWLKGEGLVKCLTEDRPHHRIYGVTQNGEAVAEEVES